MERLVIVADDKRMEWGSFLQYRTTEIAGQITARNIASLIGEGTLRWAERPTEKWSTEFVLWARDGERLTAAWTSVSPAPEIVGVSHCNVALGLVAEVLLTESARSQEEPRLQAPGFTDLGRLRAMPVKSMLGCPVMVFGRCIGVLTWVEYVAPAGSSLDQNHDAAHWALTFGRFSELRILKMCLGMNADL